jgi:predicted nucleic acid-binding protein
LTVCFDSNVLVCAFAEKERCHADALALVATLASKGLPLPDQVVREFLAVAHRKGAVDLTQAREVAALACRRFKIVPSTEDDLIAASELAQKHKLQFYDALLCCTARRAGCSVLLSQDMQDGFAFGNLRIIDPFAPANDSLVAELLA